MEKILKQDHKIWLKNRGISDYVLEKFGIYSSVADRIVIPVKNLVGQVIYNKYRRDPAHEAGPKYAYDPGSKIALYNLEIIPHSEEVIICEGELDVLILTSNGFNAVTSTGGATSFQKEWGQLFNNIDTYVCLDNDEAGRLGTIKICEIIPHAKVVPLPPEVGEHGDITDYFMKVGDKNSFRSIMKFASPIYRDAPLLKDPVLKKKYKTKGDKLTRAKNIPLESLIKFNSSGKTKCPFHVGDNTASLQKYPNNSWYCFGCGAGRDTVDFIMKRENLNFKEAIDYLLENY